jgi:hypothetical protein
VSSSRRGAVVTRDYKNSPDDCARALELLLKKPVRGCADRRVANVSMGDEEPI